VPARRFFPCECWLSGTVTQPSPKFCDGFAADDADVRLHRFISVLVTANTTTAPHPTGRLN